jgi:hypothetical protein
MDFEVAPEALRRGGAELDTLADLIRGDLTATYHAVAPDRLANPGWAATGATDTAAAAADGTLAALAGRARADGDALRAAADAYEHADERAAGRLAW